MSRLSTIDTRLNNIKQLLINSDLEDICPIFDAEDTTQTEYFTGEDKLRDNRSCDSRIVLCKQKFDFYEIMTKLKCKLFYVKSGSYGSTFKGVIFDNNGNEIHSIALKMVAYSKADKYGSINDLTRPENAEIHMLKLLSYFVIKYKTPHIILPIASFNCNIKPFLTLQNDNEKIVPKADKKYTEFIKDYNSKKFHKNVSILLSEWANRTDLGNFLKENYKTITLRQWQCLFFQLIITLAQIQDKYPSFKHNDMKANNILIEKTDVLCEMQYKIGDLDFSVQSIGRTIFLWDFDFACIEGVIDNKKCYKAWKNGYNISPKQNRYYDIHYFFCTLVYKGFLPEIINDSCVPIEVKQFIFFVIPEQFRPVYKNVTNKENPEKSGIQLCGTEKVNEKCRLTTDEEYLIPIDILKHPFFDVFRVK